MARHKPETASSNGNSIKDPLTWFTHNGSSPLSSAPTTTAPASSAAGWLHIHYTQILLIPGSSTVSSLSCTLFSHVVCAAKGEASPVTAWHRVQQRLFVARTLDPPPPIPGKTAPLSHPSSIPIPTSPSTPATATAPSPATPAWPNASSTLLQSQHKTSAPPPSPPPHPVIAPSWRAGPC